MRRNGRRGYVQLPMQGVYARPAQGTLWRAVSVRYANRHLRRWRPRIEAGDAVRARRGCAIPVEAAPTTQGAPRMQVGMFMADTLTRAAMTVLEQGGAELDQTLGTLPVPMYVAD